jgi:mRNA interferase MazF
MVISPDEMNRYLGTVLVAPMTTAGRPYPTRVRCRFKGKDTWIALDQIRAIDRSRLIRKLPRISAAAQDQIVATLAELFAR